MRDWDSAAGKEVLTDTIHGFHRVYNYNTSLGVSTKLYGMYKPLFAKKKEIQIRHVITPQISLSAAPDFGSSHYGYYKSYVYRNSNNELDTVTYSPYSNQPFGVPGRGRQGSVSFDLANNIEASTKLRRFDTQD
jgi:hypothetical protein